MRFRTFFVAIACGLALGACGVQAQGVETGPEWTLADALARHRALLREAEGLVSAEDAAGAPAPAALGDDFLALEASLVERGLLASGAIDDATERTRIAGAASSEAGRPDAEAPRTAALAAREAAPAPVSAAPPEGSAPADAAHLGRLVADGAPTSLVDGEVERLARAPRRDASEVRELVQDVLFVAVARTAVELRRRIDAVRRNTELQAALRAELKHLGASLSEASGELRDSLVGNVESLEGRLRVAREGTRLAEIDLGEQLRHQELLLRNLARVAAALHDRAMAAIRESSGG